MVEWCLESSLIQDVKCKVFICNTQNEDTFTCIIDLAITQNYGILSSELEHESQRFML